jgi:small subunit ribosomal protein S16
LMAVRIRLKRLGSKRKPFYRFIVVDSRGKRDGGFIDQVGYYNPISQPHDVKVDEDKLIDWLGKGAQMSDGARSLLKKAGFLARWEAMKGKTGAADAMVAGTAEAPPTETEAADAMVAGTAEVPPTETEAAVAQPEEPETEKEGIDEPDTT